MEGLFNQRVFLLRDPRWVQRDLAGSKSDPSEITMTEAFEYVNTVRRVSDKKKLKKVKHAADYMYVANNNFSGRLVLKRAADENLHDFPMWASCIRAPGMQVHCTSAITDSFQRDLSGVEHSVSYTRPVAQR